MLNSILKGITKIFGSKSERDLKLIYPLVSEINAEYSKLSILSNDELRGKTTEFRNFIKEKLSEIDLEISNLVSNTEDENTELTEKETIFKEIEKLRKQRNEEIEIALKEILPQAFAVVKETARRFTELKTLSVTATDHDRYLTTITKTKKPVLIDGEKAIWTKNWCRMEHGALRCAVNWRHSFT